MDYDSIRITHGTNVINLPLWGLDPDHPFITKEIQGLGPPENDLSFDNTVELGGVEGGSLPQLRQLVHKIGLQPDYALDLSVAQLRQRFYRLLTPRGTERIKYDFMNAGDVVARTECKMRRCEPDIFVKDPQISITLQTYTSYLFDINQISPDLPSLGKDAFVLHNAGDAPSGFFMQLEFTSNVTNFELTRDGSMQLLYSFLDGDILTIDTRPGQRGIDRDRAGVHLNMLRYLQPGASWFMLHDGDNNFTASTDVFDWLDIHYQPKYWGV